jgi:hypothetical protein
MGHHLRYWYYVVAQLEDKGRQNGQLGVSYTSLQGGGSGELCISGILCTLSRGFSCPDNHPYIYLRKPDWVSLELPTPVVFVEIRPMSDLLLELLPQLSQWHHRTQTDTRKAIFSPRWMPSLPDELMKLLTE